MYLAYNAADELDRLISEFVEEGKTEFDNLPWEDKRKIVGIWTLVHRATFFNRYHYAATDIEVKRFSHFLLCPLEERTRAAVRVASVREHLIFRAAGKRIQALFDAEIMRRKNRETAEV